MTTDALLIRRLGRQDYLPTWRAMQALTEARDVHSMDELWLLEHPPVFTLGRNTRPEHLLAPGDIPIVQVDRGGQVTYHGPGQVVAYVLIDLKRRGWGVRRLVSAMEHAVIALLHEAGITAEARSDAPGVYVDGAKVAALGLRVRRGCSYHGLSLNVDMDLSPFERINPCGYEGLPITQLRELGIATPQGEVAETLRGHLMQELGYNKALDGRADLTLEPAVANAS